MTARRRDRIPCIQACHPSEVALRIHFACCIFLSIELRVQRPAREPLTSSISAEVGNCPSIEETALPPVPSSFPIARSVCSSSDALPCLQSTCRTRGLIGELGMSMNYEEYNDDFPAQKEEKPAESMVGAYRTDSTDQYNSKKWNRSEDSTSL